MADGNAVSRPMLIATDAPEDSPSIRDIIPRIQRIRDWLMHHLARVLMIVHGLFMKASSLIDSHPRRHRRGEGWTILLTGTFYSDNWILAHLRPLAGSMKCARIWMVSAHPVPDVNKVTPIYPPGWLVMGLGETPARLLVFAWSAFRFRPDFVGGFHLLVNGLLASVLARLTGGRSMYFCVGGPQEVQDGGLHAENKLFSRAAQPDKELEKKLIRAVDEFDLIITMGTRAVEFFRRHGIQTRFHVVSGGIETGQFKPADGPISYDVIIVGRLAPIKRMDIFLLAIEQVSQKLPDVKAVIVGDGQLSDDLHKMAREVGVDCQIHFVGHQRDVGYWLKKAKIFALTSDSEGLALSLMEAMTCGLPAVVSNVGDLPDLVVNGINGYLVERRRPELFAERIVELLTNQEKYATFSQAALHSAQRYRLCTVTRQWDEILSQSNG